MKRRDAAAPASAAIPPATGIPPAAGNRGKRSIRFRFGDSPRRIVCPSEEPTEIRCRLGEGYRVVGVGAGAVRPGEARRDEPALPTSAGGIFEKSAAPARPGGDFRAESAKEPLAANLPTRIFDPRPTRENLEVLEVQEVLEVLEVQEVLEVLEVQEAPGSFVERRPTAGEPAAAFVTRLEPATERAARRQPPPVGRIEGVHRTPNPLDGHPAAAARPSPFLPAGR